jgi:PIN like domain
MAGEPEFFTDRSLGRRVVPDALRASGLVVHTMADVYGEQVGQGLQDETWLREIGQRGWVVLMKDDAIRRRPAERDALIEGGVRAFCLTNAQLRGEEMARRFVENRHRILRQSMRPGPYIYGVYDGRVDRLWPR